MTNNCEKSTPTPSTVQLQIVVVKTFGSSVHDMRIFNESMTHSTHYSRKITDYSTIVLVQPSKLPNTSKCKHDGTDARTHMHMYRYTNAHCTTDLRLIGEMVLPSCDLWTSSRKIPHRGGTRNTSRLPACEFTFTGLHCPPYI